MNANASPAELERELSRCETRLGQFLLARHGGFVKRESTLAILGRIAGLEEASVTEPHQLEDLLAALARTVLDDASIRDLEDDDVRRLLGEREQLLDRLRAAPPVGSVAPQAGPEPVTSTATLTDDLSPDVDAAGRDHIRNVATDRVLPPGPDAHSPIPRGGKQSVRWIAFGVVAGVAVAVVLGGALRSDAPPPAPSSSTQAVLVPRSDVEAPPAPEVVPDIPAPPLPEPPDGQDPIEPAEPGDGVDAGEQEMVAEQPGQDPELEDVAESPEESSEEPEPEPEPDPLAEAIAVADGHFAKRRFLVPARDNAFNAYRKVLDLDPGNQHARDRIRAIRQFYVNVSKRSAEQGDLEKALLFLKRAARVDPTDAMVRARIEDVKQQIVERDAEAARPAIPEFEATVPEPEAAPEEEVEEQESGFFDFLF